MAQRINNFDVPTWAGKPPTGLHLDVMKDAKMVQKLMIDEKKCYFFGRNKQACDFCIDHSSCSRVHAVLVWHKHLLRPFIVDLGSTHGTFIGTIRLESKKPQQMPIDSEIHFGASTRRYVIRERPQTVQPSMGDEKTGEEMEGGLLGLPETETELDNLTEFNTAHNRRVTSLGDIGEAVANPLKRKRKSTHVNFNEEEEVINPEDIDPSVGRFRNLISTTVIPKKKPRTDSGSSSSLTDSLTKRLHHFPYQSHLYHDLPGDGGDQTAGPGGMGSFSIAAKMGLKSLNLAPEVEEAPVPIPINPAPTVAFQQVEEPVNPLEPKKKKYAKEAWPGKKPTPSLLV